MEKEPRAYTQEEVLKQFLTGIWNILRYWENTQINPEYLKDETETGYRLSGAAHSILTLIDGCTLSFPNLDLVLSPHEDDKEFNKSQGENWYEKGMVINNTILNDVFFDYKPRKKR